MKLVIPLHSLYWSIHTKDESKRRTTFAFIFGVNWLRCCCVTVSFGVFFYEIKCNGMTSFKEFMHVARYMFVLTGIFPGNFCDISREEVGHSWINAQCPEASASSSSIYMMGPSQYGCQYDYHYDYHCDYHYHLPHLTDALFVS